MVKKNHLAIVSLGGRGEIGNNMILLENEEDIIILDAGNLFPGEEDYGVDLIIPDISYLLDKKDKIRGIIFSHGHEDHIGAIPYILDYINPPLYGTDLTMELIRGKLKNSGSLEKADIKVIKAGDKIKLNSFEIQFSHVNHSIPACVAMGIYSPVGLIIYTGDYKFDQTPINNPQTDYQQLADWGKEGVLALLGDSTNAEREGHTLSEMVVAHNLEESFQLLTSRIIIATFASNIDRIQYIIKAAAKAGRKLAISGRSMAENIEMASRLGYIQVPEGMLINLAEAKNIAPEKIILLVTGSQGEYRASLTRMARGEHRDISIKPGDTVFLSSSPIPGNEKSIGETINLLYRQGAQVIYNGMLDLHASGHACQEELKMMLNLTKPKYLLPIHGEFRHLYHHAQLARQVGIPVENIFIAENGEKVVFDGEQATMGEKIPVGRSYIEADQVSDTGQIVLNDRRRLAENGFINVIVSRDQKGNFGEPELVSRGYVYNKEAEKLLNKAREVVKSTLKEITEDPLLEEGLIKKKIYEKLKNFLYQKNKRTPFILVTILDV